MKKAEQFRAPNADQINLGVVFDPHAHGTSGNVVTGFSNPYPCPQCNILDTLINATASVVPNLRTSGDIDVCSGDPRGSVRTILSIIPGTNQGPNEKNNTRSSAAQSYLFSLPPTAKPNLHILVNHRATRIIWHNTTGQLPRPQGVAFQSQDSPAGEMMIKVEKEVIISAGTLGVSFFFFYDISLMSIKPRLQNFLNSVASETKREFKLSIISIVDLTSDMIALVF